MSVEDGGAYLGLLSFLSFAFSVIAAVTAIDTYRLLRSGEAGKPWRVLIISSVIFALIQVLFIVELLSPRMRFFGLSQVGQLMFALTISYAFYLQRQLFSATASLRRQDEAREGETERAARLRCKKLQLVNEVPEPVLPRNALQNADSTTSPEAPEASQAVDPENSSDALHFDAEHLDAEHLDAAQEDMSSVRAYETEDDIEWSQVKTASR